MAETWTVQSVEDTPWESSSPLWRVTLAKPNGDLHCHVFPHSIFDHRAAEYDIDPADINTLLDVVLHEPYLADPARLNAQDDPAAQQGYVNAQGKPAWLYNADSIEQARQAHLARIQHCKANTVRVVSPTSTGGQEAAVKDPLDALRRSYKPNLESVKKLRVRVDVIRRRMRGERVSDPDTQHPGG